MFLYYMAKVWGLAPFALTNHRAHPGSSFQVIYSITLVIMCIPELIITILKRTRIVYEGQTAITYLSDVLSLYLVNIGSCLFVTTFLLKRQKLVGIVNTLHKLDVLLSDFEVEQNYEIYFKSRAILAGTVSCITTVIIYGVNISYSMLAKDRYFTMWIIYSLITGTWINLIQYHGILTFLIGMDFVRIRYQQLNHLFSNVCTDVITIQYAWKIAPEGTGATRIGTNSVPGDNVVRPLEKLMKIEKLYDNLRTVTDDLVEIFYPPIIGSQAYFFTTILNMCYYTYIAPPTFADVGKSEGIIGMTGMSSWMILTLVQLFAIAATCSSIQKTVRISKYLEVSTKYSLFCPSLIVNIFLYQANSTATILYRMWLKHHPSELKDEVCTYVRSFLNNFVDECMQSVRIYSVPVLY